MHTSSHPADSAHAAMPRTSSAVDALSRGSECHDAVWDAVRYLSGEMAATESDAYETRLADDLDASTALADAVLLLESMQLARAGDSITTTSPLTVVAADRPANPRSQRWQSVAAIASAAMLLLAGWYAGSGVFRSSDVAMSPTSAAPQSPTDSGAELDSVLSVWVELNASRDPQTADESPLDSTFSADADAAVPDWMFAALETASFGTDNLLDGATDDELIQEGSL